MPLEPGKCKEFVRDDMTRTCRLIFLIGLAVELFCAGALRADETNAAPVRYKEMAGPFEVETVKYDWHDQKRNRDVPAKIYYPKTGGPFPVIIFSHGLGGSRDGYEYLGRHWASHGYVSVHVQHLGSDSAVWRDAPAGEKWQALERSAMNIQNAVERPKDVSFAIDQMKALNAEDGPFKGRVDLERVGVAGHSFGAFTTLAVAGETFPTLDGSGERTAVDPRVKAAIAMSSPVPALKARWDKAFAKIRIPMFHMTGTKDDSPIGSSKAPDRRVPFDKISGADQYLVTFKDGDHMVFSGHLPGQSGGENDALFQSFVLMGATAFWDAYLKDDARAKVWLTTDGFAEVLKDNGKFERKLK